MLKLMVSRLAQGIIVILFISAITFTLLSKTGGDALTLLSSNPAISEQTIQQMRHVYGLDQPLYERFGRWLGGFVRGDFGESFTFQLPVWRILKPRFLATLELAAAALCFALFFAFAFGTTAVRWPGGIMEYVSSFLVLLGSTIPRIVAALIALAIVVGTSLFPVGNTSLGLANSVLRLAVTGFVLSIPLGALMLAQVQDGLKVAMREDFITVARAKGLSESALIMRHAMRSALNPIITILGYSLGGLVSGSVIVETILGWPGIGQVSVTAVLGRDVPLLMGVVVLSATAVLLGNFIADMLLFINDPRTRPERKERKSNSREAAA